MFKDFKEFAMRGNVVDMAVGIILGAAFGTIVKSLVDDVMMPVLGLMVKGVDFSNLFVLLRAGQPAGPYTTLAAAQSAGAVTLNAGVFMNAVISFVLVAFAVFLMVRGMNKMHKKQAAPAVPTTRECPDCLSTVPLRARRCAHCTSQLAAA